MKTRSTALRAGALSLAAALMLTGCGSKIKENESIETAAPAQTTVSGADTQSEPDAEPVVTTIEQTQPEAEEIKYEKFSKKIEAEIGALSGNLKTAKKRKGFKGDGYITGFKDSGDKATFAYDLPESQFYTIIIRCASEKWTRIAVSTGDHIHYVSCDSKDFTDCLVSNIYLEKGALNLEIGYGDGAVDIDSVTVKASDEIETLDYSLDKAKLSNPNATSSAKALYSYICLNSGSRVLLGQYDSIGTNIETEAIYKLTGKYPAIRFGDLMQITTDDPKLSKDDLANSVIWSEEGGIVGLMWHWYAPCEKSDYYADKTDFDLSKAVAKEKVSQLTPEEIEKLVKKKKITQQCADLIADIDKVSEDLKPLQDQGIAVLWRPLHEASNGYFWWGKDEKSYKWLWTLMYNRMTKYHGLNNLIWVWSAQNSKWYVGDEYCDILSVDIYDQGNLSGQTDRILFLKSICATKPAAMSECGNLPSAENIVRDKGYWSYIGQWGGNFLLRDDGFIEESYNTTENLINIYNSTITVTRDELPDFTQLALSEEEAAAKKDKESNSDNKKDDKKKDDKKSDTEKEKNS